MRFDRAAIAVSFAAWTACWLGEHAASADSPEDAEMEIHLGMSLRRAGNDRDALAHFQKAYELSKGPRAMAQIALAEHALGEWIDAESHLHQALGSKEDTWIQANRETLEGALSIVQRHLGNIDVVGNVAGAEVRINGRSVGSLPLAAPVRATAGVAVIEVSADGYWPASVSTTVPSAGLARETVNLVAKPKSPPEIAEEPSPPPPKPVIDHTAAALVEPSSFPTLGFVAAGGAAAALAVGVIGLVVKNGHYSSYNDDSVCLAGGRKRIVNCGDEKSAGDTAATVSAVGFVASGALAVTSGLLFWLDAPSSEARTVAARANDTALALDSCGLGPGAIGLGCGGHFD